MIVDWVKDFEEDSSGGAPPSENSTTRYAMTIGSFDGVHQGHQSLLRAMIDDAGKSRLTSLVVTFDPLPREVLTPNDPPSRLTDIVTRVGLFEQLGIDHVMVVPFSRHLSRISAAGFLATLRSRYSMAKLWAGEDFAFGHKREGNISFLEHASAQYGFHLHVVPRTPGGDGESYQNTAAISSSRVRDAIRNGDISKARDLLGHCPSLTGIVIHGAGRGKQLGYPTANLKCESNLLLPSPGIYATWARTNGHVHGAALSVGYDPTFGTNPLSIEAHLLDFDEDIYGRRLTLYLVKRLRDEEHFDSVDALIQQMRKDVEEAKSILARHPCPHPQ